jgi:hypothetical protein
MLKKAGILQTGYDYYQLLVAEKRLYHQAVFYGSRKIYISVFSAMQLKAPVILPIIVLSLIVLH